MPRDLRKLSPAERARQERRRADFLHRPLQVGHPYRYVPTWVPFRFAQLVAGIATLRDRMGRAR